MSELLPRDLLPYNTEFFSDWADTHGLDTETYGYALRYGGFLIAILKREERYKEARLKEEIIASLPLRDCNQVEDFRLKPEFWGTEPRFFQAPEGMVFQIEAEFGVDEGYMSAEGFELEAIETETRTLVGEYLGVATYTEAGIQKGRITVYEQPQVFAIPTYNNGDPDKPGNMIRLPSRFDPEEEGAAIIFARYDDWEIARSKSRKLKGRYGKTNISLVPSAKEPDRELYIAEFEKYNEFALDDFIFTDEQRFKLPSTFTYDRFETSDFQWQYRPINSLILPPIPMDDWGPLWDNHHILIRFNPTAEPFGLGDSRFQYLDFGGPGSTDRSIREFNSFAKEGKFLMRAIAIRDMVGNTPMKDMLRIGLSKELLDEPT
jgi:hypothetical protein